MVAKTMSETRLKPLPRIQAPSTEMLLEGGILQVFLEGVYITYICVHVCVHMYIYKLIYYAGTAL